MTARRLLGVGLVVACAAGAWALAFGSALRPAIESRLPEAEREIGASVDEGLVAGQVVEAIQRLRAGRGGDSMLLSGAELTAVLRRSFPGMIPDGVGEPVIRLIDGKVLVDVRMSAAAYPAAVQLAAILEVFPDTVDVRLEGALARQGAHLVYDVHAAWAEGVHIPQPVLQAIVAAVPFGFAPDPETPEESHFARFRVAWPTGLAGMRVTGDRLELTAVERNTERVVDGSDGA